MNSLHSESLQYGSGSGQQIVTGLNDDTSYNALWIIKEGDTNGDDTKMCLSG